MIIIQKSNDKRDNYPCWHPAVDDKGSPLKPIIYCVCGQPLHLTDDHVIDEDGTVEAVYHNDPKCNFYGHLKLADYNAWKKENP
jgi:hypothetical protein